MPKTDVEFASRMDKMKDEFQVFEKNASASAVTGSVYTLPTDLHRFGSAFYEKAIGAPEIEIVSKGQSNSTDFWTFHRPCEYKCSLIYYVRTNLMHPFGGENSHTIGSVTLFFLHRTLVLPNKVPKSLFICNPKSLNWFLVRI